MTTKPVRKKSLKEAAIILLTPPYGIESDNLVKNLHRACRNNEWSLVKQIQMQAPSDVSALYKLVRKIARWHIKPVNIILDRKFPDCPENILACCCLGTLYESRLINLHTYEAENAETELQILPEAESNFLHRSAIHFKNSINSNESKCRQDLV